MRAARHGHVRGAHEPGYGLYALMNPRRRRSAWRDYLRGPVRDTAWITLGALLGSVSLVVLLAAWPRR